MNQITKIFLFLIVLTTLSCSSIRLSDNWKSDDFSTLKTEKILIVAKSKNKQISENYEKEIVNKLRDIGIDAVELHKKYPQLTGNKKPSEEELDQLIKMFKADGINGILVSSLKETKEKVKIIVEGESYYPTSTAYGKYNFTFNPDNTQSYLKYKPYSDEDVTVYISRTYFLEAISYNLSLSEKRQLTSISLVEVKDPDSELKVRTKFSKIIAKQFK